MTKRTNPNRIAVSQADLTKAKRQAQQEAVRYAWAIMFATLRDKFGWGEIRLQRLWGEVDNLSDSISKGYVKVADLMAMLKDEAGIVLTSNQNQGELVTRYE